jgi:anti-sigma factor RsiW
MRCDRAQELLGAFIDGELDGEPRASTAAHIESCASCSELVADLQRVHRAVASIGREQAPKGLVLQIRSSLARAVVQGNDGRWRLPAGVGRRLAAMAACCALSILATSWVLISSEQSRHLEQDLVTAYVRSLVQDNPIQVASSDTHTVKPWFAGRVDFAPEVKDLATEGFPLVGGRLDYVERRRVGVLVYRRRLHTVDVFMWRAQATEDAAPTLAARNGYNILAWTKDGVAYWAVSDLAVDELKRLQSLL